jgi:hypothetical protein
VILPDQVDAVQLGGQILDNKTKIEELQRTIQDPSEMTRQVDAVRGSLDTFRNATLKPRLEGRRAIIDTVGRVSSETGVQLAGAVEFTTRDPRKVAAEDARNKRNVRGGNKEGEVRSYPSLKVTFSVTGSYEQLRRFIGRLEGSDQFVVIESVSLASEREVESGGSRRAQQGGAVTLEITMTAFFQAETPVAIQ